MGILLISEELIISPVHHPFENFKPQYGHDACNEGKEIINGMHWRQVKNLLQERNIEFLGEGMRNMDVMRLSLTMPAKDGGAMGSVAAVTPTSSTYFWPTPVSETSYNKLMTPNN